MTDSVTTVKGFDTGAKSADITAAKDRVKETLKDVGDSDLIDTVTLTKTWKDMGAEAIYDFKIKVKTLTVAAGSWFVVEFPLAFAPKLNDRGVLYCESVVNTTIT